MKRVLAFDFGASSGRAMLGEFDGSRIRLEEVHRFSNDPVMVGSTMYWDVLRLFYEIKQGISKALVHGGFESIGIDTWGVDFGLIDKAGNLLENPVHYRDARTRGLIDEAFKLIPREELYEITGNQFMEINTVFQLFALARQRPELLDRADAMLLMPDLFNFMLTGVKRTEYTIASTTQMLDARKQVWSPRVLEALHIPQRLLAPIFNPGAVVGSLSQGICDELGAPPVNVVLVASHDTQSAVAAVPTQDKDFAFISCGTWSLFGAETDGALINSKSMENNMTNEGGCEGSHTFMRNIIGLWLIQESRRQWRREGAEYSYSELEKLALASEPFACFIDPDAPEFVPQGDIPGRVREFCKRTGQHVPGTVGGVMRCIYESLALKYRDAFERIETCTGKSYPVIHVVGGGVKDGLLCEMTASSCGRRVTAGPAEATVLGNIAMQLIACGEIPSIRQAREMIARSEPVTDYAPEDAGAWTEAYKHFQPFVHN